jgi:putative N6-adenine-specific DNA methylase
MGSKTAARNRRTRTRGLQQVFVRGLHDRFTVSIDSSGENLYLRGIKTHQAKHHCGKPSPLRPDARRVHRREILLDPMCGTGTFR